MGTAVTTKLLVAKIEISSSNGISFRFTSSMLNSKGYVKNLDYRFPRIFVDLLAI